MPSNDWLSEHPIWADVSNFDSAAKQASARVDETENPELDRNLTRVRRIRSYLESLLRTADPALTSTVLVDQLQSPLQQTTSELNQYVGNGNPGHLNNATNNADSLLRLLGSLRTPPDQEVEAIRGSLDSLDARIEELRDRATTGLTTLRETASALETKLTALQQQATAHESRIESALTTFESESDTRITEKEKAFGEALTSERKRAGSVVEEIENTRDRAVEIVGVIARTGMTGGYQQDAVDQNKAADRWRRFTVTFGLAAVLVLTWSALAGGPGSTAQETASRIVLSAALGGLATYAGAQAHAHRKRARRSRNLELALASLGPYLEAVADSEMRAKVLVEFTYVFFSHIVEEDDAVTSPVLREQLTALTKGFGGDEG